MSPDDIPQLTTVHAQERLLEGAILLDVRNPDERAAGFAPGSEFLPLPELADRFGELDASAEYVVVCKAGGRSQAAAEFLANEGFAVSNLDGGMLAWKAAGLEVTTPEGGIGSII
jgi:rhodanese-related sulfurtransferase